MNKDLLAIFEYLEHEKGVKRDIIIAAIEEALLTAAHKSIKGLINISVHVNPKTADIDVMAQKEVVDRVTLPDEEITLEAARQLNPYAEIGQWVDINCTPKDFGRIAAQVAGQIIGQRLRAAERDVIYAEYRDREGEMVSGVVKRLVRGATLIIDLGKVEAILPDRFYPKTEKYHVGDRVTALLFEVRETENGGAEVVLTRSHPEFVKVLFMQEVPELQDGSVAIEKIVRDAGYRTKLVVRSSEIKVDPVGALVGVRGNRVKNIIRELNNEKIDIIPYSDDPIQLLVNALAPIEPRKIDISEDQEVVSIVVDDESYPAALGKRGMNARLNGQLIDVELQVQKASDYHQLENIRRQQLALAADPSLDDNLSTLRIEGMNGLILDSLIETLTAAGYDTLRKVLSAGPDELAKIPDVSFEMAKKIVDEIYKQKGLNIG